MKLIGLLSALLPIIAMSQTLIYSPNRKLEKTVAKTYYNTEFIYIQNSAEATLSLDFELIENSLVSDWSASICTNRGCYNNIPKSGSLGTIETDAEAYISFNFAANETSAEGQVRFLITSVDNQAISDTVTFKYIVTEDGKTQSRPWASVNYAEGVLTVILDNPNLLSNINVFDLSGQVIFSSELSPITSFPLRNYGGGVYLAVLTDETGRTIKEKIRNW